MIAAFKVCVLSHPAAFVNVWLYGPDVVIICPFQLKVSHATIEEFPDDVSLIVKIIVSDTVPQG